MKKTGIILSSLLMAVSLWGQQGTQLEETVVEAPRYATTGTAEGHYATKKAPIYTYMQQRIQDANELELLDKEGVVIVRFLVEKNGTLSKLDVQNSVSTLADDCVVKCLRETSGMWLPGKVNGVAVPMESKVYVRFVIPGNGSHEETARKYLAWGVKHFERGSWLSENRYISARRSTAQFKRSMGCFNDANRYQPEEPAIVFWQACAYEKLGDEFNKAKKIKEFIEILDGPMHLETEMAEVIIRKHRK